MSSYTHSPQPWCSGTFRVGSRNKRAREQFVKLNKGSLSIGRRNYATDDIVGASIMKGGLRIHYYPLRRNCCTRSERRYAPLEIFSEDQRTCDVWSNRINRVARGLGWSDKPAPLRKMVVYINPKSGSGRARSIFRKQRSILERAGIQLNVAVTSRAGQVRSEIANMNLNKVDGFIICSGDGLVMEYINGLMDRPDWETSIRKPFGILPCGSGNGLAASLREEGREPMSPASSAYIIAKQNVRDLDMCSFQQPGLKPIYGFLSMSWGLISDIDINSEVCRCMGKARFTAYAITRLCCHKSYYGDLKYVAKNGLYHIKAGSGRNSRSDSKSSTRQGIAHSKNTHENNNEKKSQLKKSLRDLRSLQQHSRVIVNQPTASTDPCVDDDEDWVKVPTDTFTTLWAVNMSRPSEEELLARNAKIDDGVIHLSYLQGDSWCGALCGLLRLETGSFMIDSNFKQIQVEKFYLQTHYSRQPSIYSLDGEESKDNKSWVIMAVHPGVLRVFGPKQQ
eukprot:CAMPEP_0197527158 /NCGR_PEP_ID=MMETSP1318-20131121/20518_1 /TAXON_ID=552666 /ORGANISM="Partenskyella glossopodia, Strain RCC365" /LENGTH=506 /DNA_ID=CAMNT_0043081653 /DNA_START=225 /DNA_END=1745 /DNA_ORIENTATION=+